MEKTSTCPVEGRLRSRHRELWIVGRTYMLIFCERWLAQHFLCVKVLWDQGLHLRKRTKPRWTCHWAFHPGRHSNFLVPWDLISSAQTDLELEGGVEGKLWGWSRCGTERQQGPSSYFKKMIDFKIPKTFLFFGSIPLTLHGRLSWWRTTLLLGTTSGSMLTTSSLHSRTTYWGIWFRANKFWLTLTLLG